jgi:multisubunit Na+/H+ antiporter MnhE subunit
MKRLLPHPRYTAGLAVAWMVLQERFTFADFIVGYVLAAMVVYMCRNFWADRIWVKQPLGALRLALVFMREIAMANLQVAAIVLRPRMRVQPVFIKLPLKLRDDFKITALANMITLTPGTLTVDVAEDRSALYVHCLSAADADAVRRQIKESFEKPLEKVVECSPL